MPPEADGLVPTLGESVNTVERVSIMDFAAMRLKTYKYAPFLSKTQCISAHARKQVFLSLLEFSKIISGDQNIMLSSIGLLYIGDRLSDYLILRIRHGDSAAKIELISFESHQYFILGLIIELILV